MRLRHHVISRESKANECFESTRVYGGCGAGRIVGSSRVWKRFEEFAIVRAFRLSRTGKEKIDCADI